MEDLKSKEELLDEAIVKCLEDINSASGEDKQKAIDNAVKLYKLKIEDDKTGVEIQQSHSKFLNDCDEQEAARKREEATIELENRKLQDAKIDRWVHVAVAGVELVVPLVFYNVWMKRGFKFEETGRLCSDTFRGLIKFFKPTKR